IEAGIPKLRIEEAAARKQARIDSGKDIIIGVNQYEPDHEAPISILEVDNQTVRNQQIERLNRIKSSRNSKKVEDALLKLTEAAKFSINSDEDKLKDSHFRGNSNLLALAVEAARERATLGEISLALETMFGRHQAQIKSFSGVYSKEIKDDDSFKKAQQMTDAFAEQEGRRPRIMIAKMGQDGHDRGAKVVATGYADVGFDVDIAPLFQTPKEVAKQAIENDVHVLGISSLAAGHLTLVPEVVKELEKLGNNGIYIVVGGVIPQQDYDFLYKNGADAIFGPGTNLTHSAIKILEELQSAKTK